MNKRIIATLQIGLISFFMFADQNLMGPNLTLIAEDFGLVDVKDQYLGGLIPLIFWLFGGTGDYEGISFKSDDTDNILFGLMDSEYPFFKNVTNYEDPKPTDGFGLTLCSDTTSFTTGSPVLNHHMGWYIKLYHSKKVTA